MNLQNQLKEIRRKRGLTQENLAKMVGVTRQTIIAVEKARFVPSVKLALELAHALEIPFDQVFWLEESQ